MADYPRDLLKRVWAGWTYDYFLNQGKKLLPQFPPDYRREMEAMARNAPDIPADAVIAGNTLFDVKKMVACSSMLVEPGRSRDGSAMLGRNLDFPNLGYLSDYTLVTVYHPLGKRSFASVGFPGLVGVLSGMNDAGLALTMHEVYQSADGSPKFDEHGVPYALIYRRVMEECTTIEDAAALIASLPRTTSTNVALMESSGRIAVLEVSPRSVVTRYSQDGLLHCTNHFLSDKLQPTFLLNMYGTIDRELKLTELHRQPKFTRENVAYALDAVHKGKHTVQSMIFTIQSMIFQTDPQPKPRFLLHLAVGPVPATSNPYRTVDLTSLLLPNSVR